MFREHKNDLLAILDIIESSRYIPEPLERSVAKPVDVVRRFTNKKGYKARKEYWR